MGRARRGRRLGAGGRYQLLDRIGEDPLGEVWTGEDSYLARPVTVRTVHPSLAQDREFIRRFREALRLASPRLVHPSLARIFNYSESGDGPTQFVVLEPISGEGLGARLAAAGRLEPWEATTIAVQVAEALHAAHLAGVVHGALAPWSVYLTRSGQTKVMDFGLALAAWEAGRGGPGPGETPPHLAPEVAGGGPATPSADAYAVGALLLHMLMGRPPTAGPAGPSLDAAERAWVPVNVGRICDAAMASDPEARPPCGALAVMLLKGTPEVPPDWDRRWVPEEAERAATGARAVAQPVGVPVEATEGPEPVPAAAESAAAAEAAADAESVEVLEAVEALEAGPAPGGPAAGPREPPETPAAPHEAARAPAPEEPAPPPGIRGTGRADGAPTPLEVATLQTMIASEFAVGRSRGGILRRGLGAVGALLGVLAAAVREGSGAAGRLAGRALQVGLKAGWAFLRWVGPRVVGLARSVGRAIAAGTSALLRNPLRELPDLPARAPAPAGTAEEGSGIRRPESLPTGRALGPLGVVVAGPRREGDGGLGSLAGGPPDLEVLAWATSAEDALSALREVGRRRKVMVVVDLDLSGEQDARWLIRTIREKLPHIRILVVGSEASPQAVTQALLVGGDGFLRATAAPEEVVEAIRRTAAGEVVLEGLPVGAGRPGPSPPPTRRPRPPGPSSPG